MPGYTKDLISRALKSGAEFDNLSFPLKSLQHYNVIQFRSGITNESAGLGASRDLAHAYKIAYFEYLERKALFDYGIDQGFSSTNGIALHKFKFLAGLAAQSELYERDSFLLHWYSSTSFISIDIKKVLPEISSSINELKNLGFKAHFGKTFLGEQETIIATLMNIDTQGFVLGLSSGRGLQKDLEKAFLEACINLFHGDCGRSKNDLLMQIEKEGITSLSAHRTLWLYLKSLPDWFYGDQTQSVFYEKITTKLDEHLLTKSPFPVVGVKSNDLITLELGNPSNTTIDALRKRLRTGKHKEVKIWNCPHPIP